jgi:hypothetical protein
MNYFKFFNLVSITQYNNTFYAVVIALYYMLLHASNCFSAIHSIAITILVSLRDKKLPKTSQRKAQG